MRKIGFAKYKNDTKEILPKTYMVTEIKCQRRMFCTMINHYLSKQAQFNVDNNHLYENTLLHIFEDKILSFFPYYKFQPNKPQRIVKIYKEDSLLFNQYFKQSQNLKMKYMSRDIYFKANFKMLLGYKHPANDLIQLIFNGKEVEMMLDLNEIFTRTIYNRIKQEVNKTVTLDSPYIHINQHGTRTRLYPQWRNINPRNLKSRKKEIKKSFTHLHNDEIDQCYLVYPKTDGFKKYITIANESNESLKMIPYSFSYINRKENKCR